MVTKMPATDHIEKVSWRAIGRSVVGASHIKADLPNQDAIAWLPGEGIGPPLVLAVSDGHGSAKCFRSAVGSRLAVTIATQTITKLQEESSHGLDQSSIKRIAEEKLPQELVRTWREEVEKHIIAEPISSQELELLEKKAGAKACEAVKKSPILAYGATLLAVLVSESFILYMQLGDGDILIVEDTGDVNRPLPKDERLIANETTSLCSQDAWHDFRVYFQSLLEQPPALILAATDGYSNSFPDEANFQKIGPDFLEMIRINGIDNVDKKLEGWLREYSREGSGDDITLGIIKRMRQVDIDTVHDRIDKLAESSNTHVSKLNEIDSALQSLSSKVSEQKSGLEGFRARVNDLASQKTFVDKHEMLLAKYGPVQEEMTIRLQALELELPAIMQLEEENKKLADKVSKAQWVLAAAFVLAFASTVMTSVLWLQPSSANGSSQTTSNQNKATDPEARGLNERISPADNAPPQPLSSGAEANSGSRRDRRNQNRRSRQP
jgi:serine/threonine protein phosphatase PrpC